MNENTTTTTSTIATTEATIDVIEELITPYPVLVFVWFIYAMTAIVAILGNILVIYIIISSKNMRHSVTFILIANLATADFIIGFFHLPMHVSF